MVSVFSVATVEGVYVTVTLYVVDVGVAAALVTTVFITFEPETKVIACAVPDVTVVPFTVIVAAPSVAVGVIVKAGVVDVAVKVTLLGKNDGLSEPELMERPDSVELGV